MTAPTQFMEHARLPHHGLMKIRYRQQKPLSMYDQPLLFRPLTCYAGLQQGLQTFFPEGHISYYTTIRGPDISRNTIVSGYATFYNILQNQLFRKYSI